MGYIETEEKKNENSKVKLPRYHACEVRVVQQFERVANQRL